MCNKNVLLQSSCLAFTRQTIASQFAVLMVVVLIVLCRTCKLTFRAALLHSILWTWNSGNPLILVKVKYCDSKKRSENKEKLKRYFQYIFVLPGTDHLCLWCDQVSRQVLHCSCLSNITPGTCIHSTHLHLKYTSTTDYNVMHMFVHLCLSVYVCASFCLCTCTL